MFFSAVFLIAAFVVPSVLGAPSSPSADTTVNTNGNVGAVLTTVSPFLDNLKSIKSVLGSSVLTANTGLPGAQTALTSLVSTLTSGAGGLGGILGGNTLGILGGCASGFPLLNPLLGTGLGPLLTDGNPLDLTTSLLNGGLTNLLSSVLSLLGLSGLVPGGTLAPTLAALLNSLVGLHTGGCSIDIVTTLVALVQQVVVSLLGVVSAGRICQCGGNALTSGITSALAKSGLLNGLP
ncbi:hypothetical protein C8R44DRAFT_940688 [Mycena epipterygia]|nr:hypothetical protein C8R44DRAFT_940688 [Mycena epipterygia]